MSTNLHKLQYAQISLPLIHPLAGWIKMPLGREVGLVPGDIVLDGDPVPPEENGAQLPQFTAHVPCGLSPRHIVLDEDPAPRKAAQSPPLFGSCLLWPNGWMAQDATLYGGRPR